MARLPNAIAGDFVTIPLGGGRELDINYWPVLDGMRVAIWRQSDRLVVFTVPLVGALGVVAGEGVRGGMMAWGGVVGGGG